MPPKNNEPLNNNEPIIVIGLGPIGLAVALESLRHAKNRKVITFTDRGKDDYTRGQMLRLDQSTITYLENLVGEKKIDLLLQQRKLEKKFVGKEEFFFIQIMSLEKMLREALSKYENSDQLEIIYTPKDGSKKITKINTDRHTIELTDKNKTTELLFKYLIGAEGGKHLTSNLVNVDLNQKINAQDVALMNSFVTSYDNMQIPQTYNHHVTTIFKLPEEENSKTYQNLVGEKNEKNISIEEFRKFGWKLNAKPDSTTVLLIKNKLYIGSEYPKEISEIKNPIEKKKKLNEWAKLILKYYLDEKEIEKLEPMQYKETEKGEIKNFLQASAFEVILEEANRTITPFPPEDYQILDEETLHKETAYFFQLGDSLRKPHYQTGTGVITGFSEVKAYGEFLESDQSIESLSKYHAHIAAIRADNRQKVDEYLEEQKQKEAKAMSISNKELLFKICQEITLELTNYIKSYESQEKSISTTLFSSKNKLSLISYENAKIVMKKLDDLSTNILQGIEKEQKKIEDYLEDFNQFLLDANKKSSNDNDFRAILSNAEDAIQSLKDKLNSSPKFNS